MCVCVCVCVAVHEKRSAAAGFKRTEIHAGHEGKQCRAYRTARDESLTHVAALLTRHPHATHTNPIVAVASFGGAVLLCSLK